VLELRRLRFAGSDSPASPELQSSGRLDELILRDRRAMGFDRSALLHEFAGRPGSQLMARDGAVALIRDGRTARQIGPLYGDSTAAAIAMIGAIAASQTGPFLIDVVESHGEFLGALTSSGWNIERPFQRMRFGRAPTASAELSFAVAGPEFG
jgi:hypothetical protein